MAKRREGVIATSSAKLNSYELSYELSYMNFISFFPEEEV